MKPIPYDKNEMWHIELKNKDTSEMYEGEYTNDPLFNVEKIFESVADDVENLALETVFSKVMIEAISPEFKEKIKYDVVVPGIKNIIRDIFLYILADNKIYFNNDYDTKKREAYEIKELEDDICKIQFETKDDANLVLKRLEETINAYGCAYIEDFYDLAGVTCRNKYSFKYGWTNIRNAQVVENPHNGFKLKMPRPIKIINNKEGDCK